jgi:hypothetical protein
MIAIMEDQVAKTFPVGAVAIHSSMGSSEVEQVPYPLTSVYA